LKAKEAGGRLQKIQSERNCVPVARKKRMGRMNDPMKLRALQPGALDGDLSVVLSWNHQTVDPIDGTIAGDDKGGAIDGAEN
jgi:hypothetical protein